MRNFLTNSIASLLKWASLPKRAPYLVFRNELVFSNELVFPKELVFLKELVFSNEIVFLNEPVFQKYLPIRNGRLDVTNASYHNYFNKMHVMHKTWRVSTCKLDLHTCPSPIGIDR